MSFFSLLVFLFWITHSSMVSPIYIQIHVNKYLLVFLLLIWLLVQVPQPRTQKFRGRIALPLLHISFWAMVCKQKWHESLQAAVGCSPAGPPFPLPGAPATLEGELLHHSGSWREKTGQRPQPVPMSIWCTWKMKPGCLSPWDVLGFIALLLLQHNLAYPGWHSNTSYFSQHFLKTTYSYMMVYIQDRFFEHLFWIRLQARLWKYSEKSKNSVVLENQELEKSLPEKEF